MERGFGTRPISDGFIAIGWSSIGDLSKIPASRDAFKKAVANTCPQMKAGAFSVIAGTLFKFFNEMKKGDIVMYPSKVDRMVNFGVIQGG